MPHAGGARLISGFLPINTLGEVLHYIGGSNSVECTAGSISQNTDVESNGSGL